MRGRSSIHLLAALLSCVDTAALAGPQEPDRADLIERARRAGRAAADAATGPAAVPIEPYSSYQGRPAELGISGCEELRLPADGGVELRAWFLPARGGGKPKGTVIVLHGLGANIGFALMQSAFLLDRGYQLYLLDARPNSFVGDDARYRGFLREDLADISRAIEAVRARPDVDPSRVALYGFSYGGAKALLAGAEHPEVRAVISDGAPTLDATGLIGAFEEKMPPFARGDLGLFGEFIGAFGAEMHRLLGYWPAFDVPASAARISPRPLLVIHSREDPMVPFHNAEVIAKIARPTQVMFGDTFGHCLGMKTTPDRYIPPVVAFLDAAMR